MTLLKHAQVGTLPTIAVALPGPVLCVTITWADDEITTVYPSETLAGRPPPPPHPASGHTPASLHAARNTVDERELSPTRGRLS